MKTVTPTNMTMTILANRIHQDSHEYIYKLLILSKMVKRTSVDHLEHLGHLGSVFTDDAA